jgi:hypothetical protein
MLYQYQMPIPGLGISIVFVSNGMLALVPHGRFPPTMDISQDDCWALFSHDSFCFFHGDVEEQLVYGTMYNYRSFPLFLKWLQAQRLLNPFQENHAT